MAEGALLRVLCARELREPSFKSRFCARTCPGARALSAATAVVLVKVICKLLSIRGSGWLAQLFSPLLGPIRRSGDLPLRAWQRVKPGAHARMIIRARLDWADIVGHWALRGYGNFACIEKASGAFLGRCGPWF